MKDAAKYAASLLTFIVAAFVLSWAAVYSYWFAAHLFHTVRAVRICESIGAVILAPVRGAFWLCGDLFDQSAPLTDPMSYAAVNAVIIGTGAYFCGRRLLFGKSGGEKIRGAR